MKRFQEAEFWKMEIKKFREFLKGGHWGTEATAFNKFILFANCPFVMDILRNAFDVNHRFRTNTYVGI